MKSILVPVDFSGIAENSASYALHLAAVYEAEVTLLYCIPPGSDNHSPFVITPYAELQENAQRKMHLFQHKCLTALKNILVPMPKVDSIIKYGDLNDIVGAIVEENTIDLIVMGTKGKSDAWRSTFGSNATYLLNAAPCPVLVVPAIATYRDIKRICIGEQRVDDDSLNHLEEYRKFFAPLKPEVHLLHVQQDDSEAPDFVDNYMEKLRSRPELVANTVVTSAMNTEVVSGLLNYAKDNRCELVIMNRPSKSWLERIFAISNTRQAILESELPILITRPENFS